ncbi:hypothetical protein EEB11_17110 [Pseudotabrizicola sediminis]|uniref:Uncharacterized protein n=1 Tax=Pseudotabrizicola sediminis TaxID=2486418 RepID=A0ABY2KIN5_9RHOB|nr:hypothetical protein [Pseudotabrizicola sediminis]TGD41744.1 hypothetical protein EEB11_17110 [Pseudotabrizicola sediminis]
MYTRSAIFKGLIKPGKEEEFYAAVEEHLIPAWSQMLYAQAVRVYRPIESEDGLTDIFLVQEIDYPSREAIAEALASPRRLVAMQALERVRPLYVGQHHHIIYRKLTRSVV